LANHVHVTALSTETFAGLRQPQSTDLHSLMTQHNFNHTNCLSIAIKQPIFTMSQYTKDESIIQEALNRYIHEKRENPKLSQAKIARMYNIDPQVIKR
jgi:DNA-binding transcriptional regulator YiaG